MNLDKRTPVYMLCSGSGETSGSDEIYFRCSNLVKEQANNLEKIEKIRHKVLTYILEIQAQNYTT